MDNKVLITDDELSCIITSLEMSIKSFEKYKENNGLNGLDNTTLNTIAEITALYKRLQKEFF